MTFAEDRERMIASFEALTEGLAAVLVRAPSYPPTLDFVDDTESRKLAELVRAPEGGCRIRIHRPLLDGLEQIIRGERHALKTACLAGITDDEQNADTESALLACVLDVSETFALLHECCHFWCGHWDALGGASLDEGELHLGVDGSDPASARVLESYYLELEADGSALQLLMQRLDFASLRALFSSLDGLSLDDADAAALFALNERQRVIGYRVLLAAIWIVIQLFENRKTSARASQRFHPLPSARLLAAVFTATAQYAELTSEEFDETGLISQPLDDDEQVTDLQQLFRQVLSPVLGAGWRLSDGAAAHEGFRTAPVWIAQEIGLLLLEQEPRTAAGRELVAVQALRAAMLERLRSLRYLPHELPE